MSKVKRLALLCCPIAFLVLTACNRPEPPVGTSGFRAVLDPALSKAKTENKVVMVDFGAEWCGWCKKLDDTTWKDAKVKDWLNRRVVFLKIDVDKVKGVPSKYTAEGLPTILFLKPDGSELGRIVGYRPPDLFLKDAGNLVNRKQATY